MTSDTWKEWSKWVIETIKKCQTDIDKIKDTDIVGILEKLSKLQTEIAVQKIKVGIWGAIGAAVPVCATLVALYLKGVLK